MREQALSQGRGEGGARGGRVRCRRGEGGSVGMKKGNMGGGHEGGSEMRCWAEAARVKE